jgi:hypothetical protein
MKLIADQPHTDIMEIQTRGGKTEVIFSATIPPRTPGVAENPNDVTPEAHHESEAVEKNLSASSI